MKNPTSRLLVDFASDIMKESIDPVHNFEHVNAVLRNYRAFMKNSREIESIDEDVMMLSIYWHDVWKSKRLSKNMIGYLYDQFFDGLGSAAMFRKQAKKYNLPLDLIKKVSYTIKKHASLQVLPKLTKESKILWDMDELELFSYERFKKTIKQYSFLNEKTALIYLKTIDEGDFYFNWSKNEYRRRKKEFFRKVVAKGLEPLASAV